jgi:fumarylacetoacetase
VNDGGFGLANLPYGVCRHDGRTFCAVRVRDTAVDLAALADGGLLDVPKGVFATGTLNAFMALGPDVWQATRARLRAIDLEQAAVALDDVELLMPFAVADYADFYSSEHHARNMGLILRPGSPPLLPNWKRLPVGYHGRAATVVVSGTPVVRPRGIVAVPDGEPEWRPSGALDIELEVGAVLGVGNALGTRIAADDADHHVFGFVLLNDWSARDIQAYEYQPLGPFLGKSFATTVSPWVVPLDALRPFLVDGPPQDPPPAPYLRARRPWGIDASLSVVLDGSTIAATNLRHLYWSFAQQLAHLTGNGAATRTGDLLGSGTISGPEPGSFGSLMELTWRGRDPITLADGTVRTFLADGDTVTLTGRAGDGEGAVSFGECTGTIHPAPYDEEEPCPTTAASAPSPASATSSSPTVTGGTAPRS